MLKIQWRPRKSHSQPQTDGSRLNKATASSTTSIRARLLRIAAVCLAGWFVLAWIGAKLLIVKSELQSADAIVVLSGPATYIERTDCAARLYREGRAPIVVLSNEGLLSGWSKVEERNPYFYELAVKELEQRGAPATNIEIVSNIGAGTYQECLRLRDYAATHKLKRLLLVTSAYHSRRALWSMRRACKGSDIEVGIDGPSPGWQTPSPGFWWLHEFGWRLVAGEYVKLVYYRLAY